MAELQKYCALMWVVVLIFRKSTHENRKLNISSDPISASCVEFPSFSYVCHYPFYRIDRMLTLRALARIPSCEEWLCPFWFRPFHAKRSGLHGPCVELTECVLSRSSSTIGQQSYKDGWAFTGLPRGHGMFSIFSGQRFRALQHPHRWPGQRFQETTSGWCLWTLDCCSWLNCR